MKLLKFATLLKPISKEICKMDRFECLIKRIASRTTIPEMNAFADFPLLAAQSSESLLLVSFNLLA
jgi:hypothetical protein